MTNRRKFKLKVEIEFYGAERWEKELSEDVHLQYERGYLKGEGISQYIVEIADDIINEKATIEEVKGDG